MSLLSRLLVSLSLCLLAPLAAAQGSAELAAAVRAGDLEQVQTLLKAGVSPSAAAGAGAAPILIAASRGKHDIARALLARGADSNARYAAYYDATALMLAVNNRDAAMLQLLLDAGAAVNLVDSNGDPALNWACFYGDLGAADLLLRHGADPTLVGHGNALEVSMRRGHQALVERLVDAMQRRVVLAPPQQRLVAAIDGGDATLVGALLKSGADARGVDSTGRPLLARAARQGHAAVVQALLQGGAAVDGTDDIGFTALLEAARDGRGEVVSALLKAGARPTHASAPRGLALTALHLAASAVPARPDMLRQLAAAGAPLDARDVEQATPLMWAINADPAAAQLLVELGADPDLLPQTGKSPRQTANQRDLKGLLAVMQRKKPV